MANEFEDLSKIRHVKTGDPVASKPTSQPTRALELRLNQLEQLIDRLNQSTALTKLIIPNVPIKTGSEAVELDDVVYFNGNTGLYEKALAGVTVMSGVYQNNPSALAIGICVAVRGALGDIMIAGYDTWRDETHKEKMLEDMEEFTPGVAYYLSGRSPGKLTRHPPALRIQIMVPTDKHYVLEPTYGNPDSLDSPIKQAIGMRPVGGLR